MPDTSKPLILLDLLAYGPQDAGFTTAAHSLCETTLELANYEFIIVTSSRYAHEFRRYRHKIIPIPIPNKARFFVSLFLMPIIALVVKPHLAHFEISARPPLLGCKSTVTVNDLHFMRDSSMHKRSFGGKLIGMYWRNVFLWGVRRATGVRSISQATASDLREFLPNAPAPLIVYPRIETEASKPLPRIFPTKEKPLVILFIGSIIPRKNLPYLLSALKKVQRNWELIIVGNAWWGLDAVKDGLDDERIRVLGYVSDERRKGLMNRAHILISPSICEGFGLPVAEAMAENLPVLVSDIEVYREIAPAQALFSLQTPDALASKIDSLDVTSYKELIHACREKAGAFVPQSHIKGFCQLFESALHS